MNAKINDTVFVKYSNIQGIIERFVAVPHTGFFFLTIRVISSCRSDVSEGTSTTLTVRASEVTAL